MWWSVTVLPIFRSATSAREVTERIIADQRFKPGVLGEEFARREHEPERAVEQASFRRAQALLGLGVAEETIGKGSPEEADRQVIEAVERLRMSLELNPGDSFLWLMFYSIEIARAGFGIEKIAYLDQSYATGPHEGWVALRRNRLALSIFRLLGEPQKRRTVTEFAHMVGSDFIEAAAFNLTRVGWTNRDQLLGSLAAVDIASRQSLAKQLSNEGYKAIIPGIDAEDRPWR
ncbi:hypothetical protein IVB38_38030 [Bradyrhizobium sp. 38]|uniref:hypothetical protein n=1 Tax=unclassified Bradyrhizobium TaxID=2631580 RepID=UPI001FF78DF3|nr:MULTISPECIES: hypothetical protein [unclassified Bradyrhizobium]MCK1341630.1 hypothetical protein [Bradyrhizobium sp. 38]MCK1778839.1 hypothetical protein [Bradyrhizobium sp. 132]